MSRPTETDEKIMYKSTRCPMFFTFINVFAVLWRMFSTVEGYKCCGDTISIVGGYHQYCGGIPSVQGRDTISIGGDISSIEEG